ncbi:replicative DNA helicase [Leucobacter weissii]|uniref:Replicative DNA helicase n=1 Tax=Leucobacter weissii TaxID=1983706 RepID=A0A939MMC3_9MICO|nr:replicative DNA helicase [Leucobacter weissii]
MSIAHLGLSGVEDGFDGPSRGFERTPPYDLLAEQSVLGGMLLSKDAVADVTGLLRGPDFYVPKHEVVYEAILSLYAQGEPTDAITVTDQLGKTGDLQRAGGAEYLHTVTSIVPTAANASFYAEIVAEKALLRRLVEAGTRITQMGYAGEGEAIDLVNNAQAEIYAVTGADQVDDYVPLSLAVEAAVHEIEQAQLHDGGMLGVPTGFTELDEKTNGFAPGQMIIIAARPAMGKSTLALDVARSAAVGAGATTVFFSLEMGRAEIAMRLLAAEASIPMQTLRKGQLDSRDFQKLAATQARVNEAPLFIDDSPNLTLVEIRAKCRRLKQRNDLKMVVIDYLQLLSSGKKSESRQQEVSEFSRALKLLSKELEVPVVALSQLNRASEQRADKMPAISDLRESGSLEQDADMVILLHRESTYEKDHPRAGEADLILAKQRNGPTGTVTVAFQGHYSRFQDMPS